MGLNDLFAKKRPTENAKPMAERVDANAMDDQETTQTFDDDAFWRKIARVLKNKSKKAVNEVLLLALQLYYVMLDDDTPTWAKTVILGALAYFVVPVDLMPDILPTGYLDDVGTLSAAVGTVHSHIKQEHQDKAQEKIDNWFGPDPAPNSDAETSSEQKA